METVFVGNLSYFTSNKQLVDLFSTFGVVHSAVVRKSKRNLPLHYGFVQMNVADAHLAVAELDGIQFLGRRLR